MQTEHLLLLNGYTTQVKLCELTEVAMNEELMEVFNQNMLSVVNCAQ